MGVQVCTNEGPPPLPRGDNYRIAKIHYPSLKIFFRLQNHFPISSKFGTKHPWVKKTHGFTYEDHLIIKKKMMGFTSPNQHYVMIIVVSKCVLIWTGFFFKWAMWPMGLLSYFTFDFADNGIEHESWWPKKLMAFKSNKGRNGEKKIKIRKGILCECNI